MPWKHLSTWFAERQTIPVPVPVPVPMPLTMVTLRATESADAAALAFHTEAEFEALIDWALAGRFVLAFVSMDGAELTLFCTEPEAVLTPHVQALPLIAAGLASADLHTVVPLKLTTGGPVLLH